MNGDKASFTAVCKGEQLMYGKGDKSDAPSGQVYVMTGDPKTGSLTVPHLILAVSYDCNLNCAHCYNERPAAKHLSMDDWKSIISQWAYYVHKEHGEYGGIVHFKGGEPLLFSGIRDLLEFSSEKKLRIMITTNGTITGKRTMEMLGKANKAVHENFKLIVSLDGSDEETNSLLRGPGAFAKTMKFIKEIKRLGIAFDINFVTHSGNQHDIESSIRLARRLGAVQFNVLPLIIKGNAKSNGIRKADNDVLIGVLKKAYGSKDAKTRGMLTGSLVEIMNRVSSGDFRCLECVAGYRGLLYILPDGSTYSCPNTVLPDFYAGNIIDIGIKGAVESDVFRRLRNTCSQVPQNQKTEDVVNICMNRNF